MICISSILQRSGIVLAFVFARTFSRIRVGPYCDGLNCGTPLGLLDWTMVSQTALGLAENIGLFGATALVLEYFIAKGYIMKMEE